MALAKSIAHYQGWEVDLTQSVTTTSFTPENNSLLVALINCQLDNLGVGLSFSQTVSGGGLTWNFIDEYDIVDNYELKAFAYYAEVSTASSMTFTFDSNDSNGLIGPAIIIYNFTGYNTASPIGGSYASGGQNSRSGAYNATLSATPDSTSYIVAAAMTDDGTTTYGTNWTNDQNDVTGDSSGPYLDYAAQSRTNWTSTTVAWDAISTSGSWASIGVEIKEAEPQTINRRTFSIIMT